MTPPEYIQLKAFARIDGALLSLLWTCSFACYIVGLTSQIASLLALVLIFVTPFFVFSRLKTFRDVARDGVISFMRSWAYVVFVFFYASILFSLIVFAYFAFLDHGYVVHILQETLERPEMVEVIKLNNMEEMMNQMMSELSMVRPIDIAINILPTNILMGMILGLPIAWVMMLKKK